MDFELNALKRGRENFLKTIEAFDEEQMNRIPKGFNNNLAWNLGHIVVTHQIICYQLAGIPCKIEEDLINKYRKGTKPEVTISSEEIQYFKDQSIVLIDKHNKDLENGIFFNFKEYQTSYGVVLRSVNDSIIFNIMHENLHLGYVMAMKKLIQ